MLIDALLAGCMRYAVGRHMKLRRIEAPFRLQVGDAQPRLLYIHIPFCETLCPYCSFHRVRFERSLAIRYFQRLRREIEIYRDEGFCFDSVYVGGGSPTVMPAELGALIGYVRGLWPLNRVSVEAHPRHLTSETIAILHDAGVDRLSIGVQTFDERLLAKLSRSQDVGANESARERLLAVKDQFDAVNVDMIYDLPEQTSEMVREDVRILRDLGVDQLTFYPLMDGGTDSWRTSRRTDRRKQRPLYYEIVSALGDEYEPVSAWCFSRRKGLPDEYIVTHDEYAGLGSGAFGYLNGTLYANSFDVEKYIGTLGDGRLPIVAAVKIPDHERIRYDLLMRLFSGSFDGSLMEGKYGKALARGLWKELLLFRASGTIVRRDGRYRVTPRGRYHMVILMREFFAGTNRMREFLGRGLSDAPA